MQRRRLPALFLTACLTYAGCGDDSEPDSPYDAADGGGRADNEEDDEGDNERDASPDARQSTSPTSVRPTSRTDAGTPPARDAADAAAPRGGSDGGLAAGGGAAGKVLHTEGRYILDTCGERWLARGMEQLAAKAFSADETLEGIVREIALTGSNAVRILPVIDEVSAKDLDALLTSFAAQRIVVYISPGDRTWFARSDIKTVLLRHEKGLILDAFQEPDHSDEQRWVGQVLDAIKAVRAVGYTCPLTVLSLSYGRNLPMALDHGQEFVDADPLHNTVVGWQAYWGKGGWYQSEYKMTLAEGVKAAADENFPIQIGIDLYSDKDDMMDYQTVMAAAQQHGVGWLWWNWWNQWDDSNNNASSDGTYANLTPAGRVVVTSDPNSIQKTSKKACFR